MSRPRPKYQVFISSTFSDLHGERQAVTLEVLAARHIPSGMESFPATDDRGWQTIQRTIDMADYYVLLLAGRYGTVDASTGLSWTEREYEYARSKGVPVLAFLREKGSITANKMEDAPDMQARIADFVKKVRAAHLVKDWRQVDDLKGLVVHALTQHIADDEDGGTPRPGWFRGTDMPSAEVAAELARLSAENADLRQRLAAHDSESRPKLSLVLTNGKAIKKTLEDTRKRYRLIDTDGTMGGPVGPVARPSAELSPFSPLPGSCEKYIARVNQTIWVRLAVKNVGTSPAKVVTVRFTVPSSGVSRVLTYNDDVPGVRAPNAAGVRHDPNQLVYCEPIRRPSGDHEVVQRIRSVGVGATEQLVAFGIVTGAPSSPVSIRYNLADEAGNGTDGTFMIALKLQGVRTVREKDLDSL